MKIVYCVYFGTSSQLGDRRPGYYFGAGNDEYTGTGINYPKMLEGLTEEACESELDFSHATPINQIPQIEAIGSTKDFLEHFSPMEDREFQFLKTLFKNRFQSNINF